VKRIIFHPFLEKPPTKVFHSNISPLKRWKGLFHHVFVFGASSLLNFGFLCIIMKKKQQELEVSLSRFDAVGHLMVVALTNWQSSKQSSSVPSKLP